MKRGLTPFLLLYHIWVDFKSINKGFKRRCDINATKTFVMDANLNSWWILCNIKIKYVTSAIIGKWNALIT